MSEPFKSIIKPYNGKILPCKVCSKTPNEGDQLWMQNIGTEENKKWIASPHEECFKKLQQNPEIGKKTGGKPFVSQKFPIADAPQIYNLCEELLNSFYKKRGIVHDALENKRLSIEQEAIFIESTFRTLSTGFKP